MAYTQIHAIKATLGKAVAYITNGQKTEEKVLVSSYGCGPETATFDFAATLSKAGDHNPNLGYHLIQSFYPGEVTFSEAHKIGNELAERLLGGKYAYVVSTHIDKNHVHNHIIFCSANFVDYGKFNSCKKTNYLIRRISDELCVEHGLSVIIPSQKKGQKYIEWQSNKIGVSIRETLKKDIDSCIKASNSYLMFLSLMRANGYEIKGESFGEYSLKYIAFKPQGGKQFFRGCDRTFGPGYTKEAIVERIEEAAKHVQKAESVTFSSIPTKSHHLKEPQKAITLEELLKRKAKTLTSWKDMKLIDTNTDRMRSSPALMDWAKRQNLQTLAHAYANMDSLSSFREEISGKKAALSSMKEALADMEKRKIPAAEIAHTAKVCKENMRYEVAMQKSKDPDRYYREHAEKLTLYRSAKHILETKYGFKVDTLDFDQIQEKFSIMQAKIDSLQEGIQNITEEIKDYEEVLLALEEYLGVNEKKPETEKGSQEQAKTFRQKRKDMHL